MGFWPVMSCTDSEADQAIAALKDVATSSRYAELYEKGLETYKLIRDGISVSQGYGKVNRTINFIDWKDLRNNDFAVAQEVTVCRVSRPLGAALYILQAATTCRTEGFDWEMVGRHG